MVGGIAEQINTVSCDASKLGTFSYATINLNNNKEIVIVNGYTQLLPGGKVKYDALREVIKKVKGNFHGQQIRYPMIGFHRVGGKWGLIEKIIEEELNGDQFLSLLGVRHTVGKL